MGWTSHLSFSEFASWCMDTRGILQNLKLDDSDNEEVARYEARASIQKAHTELDLDGDSDVDDSDREKVTSIFSEFDSDGSGRISAEELAAILMKLDRKM